MPTLEYRNCLAPYEGYHSSGPRYDKSLDRMYVHLLRKGSKPIKLSYARYLYAVSTGQEVPTDKEVDHIDGHRLNDSIANLQLLEKLDNTAKAHKDPRGLALQKRVKLACPHCGQLFIKRRSATSLSPNRGALTYCSKSCGYHYREHVGESQLIEEIAPSVLPTIICSEPWEQWTSERESGPARPYLMETPRGCKQCGETYYSKDRSQSHCSRACASLTIGEKKTRIDNDKVLELAKKAAAKEMSWEAAGRELGVCGNSVKKWAKKLGITYKTIKYATSNRRSQRAKELPRNKSDDGLFSLEMKYPSPAPVG